MRIALLFVAMLAPTVAYADRWIPYTDGRVGGCFQSDTGRLYGCTPQPNKSSRSGDDFYFQRPNDSHVKELEQRTRELEEQNRAFQMERNRQNAIDREKAEAKQRRIKELDYIYTMQRLRDQANQSRERQSQRETAISRCVGPAYSDKLKKLGLKQHPSVRGVCVPIGWKPGTGSISARECPPC